MNWTLRSLRYFLAAAQHQSFKGAADELNVSASAVAAMIGALEDEFGYPLFFRHRAKGVFLTREGRRFYLRAKRLIDASAAFETEAAALAQEMAGGLRLIYFAPFSATFLPQIIGDFSKRFPKVKIELSEINMSEIPERLTNGQSDLAIMFNIGVTDEIEFIRLAAAPPYALMPKGDRLESRSAIRLDDLTDRPLILIDYPVSREFYLNYLRAHGIKRSDLLFLPSPEMIRGMSAEGYGYALLNMRPATEKTYAGTSVVCKPIISDEPAPILGLAYPKQLPPNKIQRLFIETAQSFFSRSETDRYFVRLREGQRSKK